MQKEAKMSNYESLHPNFKNDYTPENLKAGKISTQTPWEKVPPLFKAFIPPGATKTTMIVKGAQYVVVGAMARVDNEPQCTYAMMKPDKAEKLPWDKPTDGTLEEMREKDYQKNMTDQQIEVLDFGTPDGTEAGHWVYVKIMKYSSTKLAIVQYSVDLNMDTYTKWYKSNPDWQGNDAPATPPGPTGGYCDPAWAGK